MRDDGTNEDPRGLEMVLRKAGDDVDLLCALCILADHMLAKRDPKDAKRNLTR